VLRAVDVNVSGNSTMVWFYALRDGTWYYVEAGGYTENNGRCAARAELTHSSPAQQLSA